MGKIGASNFNEKLARGADKPRTHTSAAGAGAGAAAGVGAGAYTSRTAEPPLPPPSRGGAAKQGNRAQAQYDYDGGDATDLPVKENQIVTIVAKTSEDCECCHNVR